MPRTPSPVDIELAHEATARGREVSPRQVERWRQAGFFTYTRTFLGRGKGSASTYAPETVDRVVEIAAIVGQRRSLRDAALILHARGHPIQTALVRDSLVDYVDQSERALRDILARAAAGTSASDLLRKSKRGRAVQRRLHSSGLTDDAFLGLIAGFLGERDGWVPTLLSATGFDVIGSAFLDDETYENLRQFLEPLSLPALRAIAEQAPDDELRRAAADAQIVVPYIAAFIELLSRLGGRKDIEPLLGKTGLDVELAIGHWTVLSIWARRGGLQIDQAVAQARELGPALTAMLELLRRFSFTRSRLFAGDVEANLHSLPPHERESIAERVRSFAQEEPDHAAALARAGQPSPREPLTAQNP